MGAAKFLPFFKKKYPKNQSTGTIQQTNKPTIQLYFMKKITSLFALLCSALIVFGQDPVPPAAYNVTKEEAAPAGAPAGKQNEYVTKYKDIAIGEMERTGIPASIKLAQAILESDFGKSDLATQANNHFGVKCATGWTGKTMEKVDDEKDEDGQPKKSCFRKYGKVEDSYYDHSEFLRDPRKYYRYGFLFGLDKTDYRSWARGLESSGYATGAGYADKLINVIERYQLYQYDSPDTRNSSSQPSSRNRDNDPSAPQLTGRIGRINDVKAVSSRAGETLDDIARTFRISPEKVADFNERRYTPGQPLPTSTRIFIQKKKSKWRGRTSHHFVRDDQTMFEISQLYGVRMKDLLKRNGLTEGQEVAAGERVRIKGRRKSDELVRLRDVTTPATPGKPATPTRPSTTKPSKPTTDEELPEITGNGQQTQPPATGKPSTTTTTPTSPTRPSTPPPAPTPTRPSTSTPSTTPPPTYPQDPVPVSEPVSTTPPPAAGTYHTVVKGDTLFSLSRKYGTPVAKIKSLNGMTADDIKIGQKLRVK
jgi:LysM repeat protein